MKEKDGLGMMCWRGFEDGVVAVWMEAADDARAWGAVDFEALGTDGYAAVGADAHGGALAENVGPPGAARSGAQGGAFVAQRQIPGGLRGGAQFAVNLVLVVVGAELVEERIGGGEGGDLLGGKKGGQPFLPEVMGALDLAFGLRSRGVAQGDLVKAQRGAELSERVGLMSEEEW
jgi:hypothetical protein